MKQSVYIIQSPPSWLNTAPLSLACLSTYLKNKGFSVKTNDINLELFRLFNVKQKEWLSLNIDFEKQIFGQVKIKTPLVIDRLIKDIKNYDAIGFSLLKRNYIFSMALAKKIREEFPHKKIIFGGPHTLFLDLESKLDPNFNWVIGEGEAPLAEMLSSSSEKILRFKELINLEETGLLDFDSVNPLDYSQSIPLVTSRGCPFNCKFCSENKLYKRFRHYGVEFMIEQIKYLKYKYKGENFTFCDSLINYNNAWLDEFCKRLIKENISIKWQAQIRVDNSFTKDLGDVMRKSGCYNLFVGLESASDNVLKNMNKGFTADAARGFFEKLNESSLQFEISLIFGYPEETDDDFNETIEFIVKNKKIIPKIAQANPFVDYLGEFKEKQFPTKKAFQRILAFLSVLEKEKIKYTKSFINNLTYLAKGELNGN